MKRIYLSRQELLYTLFVNKIVGESRVRNVDILLGRAMSIAETAVNERFRVDILNHPSDQDERNLKARTGIQNLII